MDGKLEKASKELRIKKKGRGHKTMMDLRRKPDAGPEMIKVKKACGHVLMVAV